MVDLSQMSDDDLLKLHAQMQAPKADLSKMSDSDLLKLHAQLQSNVPPPEESTGKKLVRGVINSLPGVGMIGGGAVGTAAGPIGTVGGAAMGYAGGKELSSLLKQYILGDAPESAKPGDQAARVATNLKDGAMYEMGGQSIAAVPGLVKAGAGAVKNLAANKLGQNAVEFTPIANKEAVEQAAKNLNIDLPKGVLTDNPTYQKLESGLSQSGSLPAKPIRDQYNQMFKGLDAASNKVADLKSPDSDFAIGKQIQTTLTKSVKDSQTPVAEMYKDLSPSLQKIPVNEQVVNTQFGALKRNPLFQTKDGAEMLEEYKSTALSQPELNSLKEWRSTLGDSVGPNSSPIEAKRIQALRDTVTKIRDNSINSMKLDLPKDAHGEVDNLINQMALADKAHASNIDDINSIKGIVGNKDFGSPSSFVNKLSDMKEADVAQRASNLDVSSLKNLQDKFPSVFEKAKAAKVNDMVQGATNAVSGFSDARFLKQYDSMDKELKDLIFDKNMQAHISDLKTVRQAIPPKLGPSGTPEGQMMMDMVNPKRNALDYGIKSALNKVAAPAETALPAKALVGNKSATVIQGIFTKPSKNIAIPSAADTNLKDPNQEQAVQKGRERWASDGFMKLMSHTSKSDAGAANQLSTLKSQILSDPKGKDLLIAASDLTPGSKAMENILAKIKSRYGGKN